MNICLSIESTSRQLGLSLLEFKETGENRLLSSFLSTSCDRQSELLIPTLEKMLSEGPWKRTNIRLIGVDVGPGSFTGVRVGLAVARTLAQGLKVPLVGISSLEAMARAVAEKLSQKNYSSSPRKPIGQDEGVVQSVFKYDLQHSSKVLVPWFPATAGEVYFAVYKNGRVVVAPCWRSEADMRNILRRFPDHVITTEPASSQVIAELAIEKYLKKPSSKKFHFENVVPQYLQPSWAERSKRSR